jgi:hypothetical protein
MPSALLRSQPCFISRITAAVRTSHSVILLATSASRNNSPSFCRQVGNDVSAIVCGLFDRSINSATLYLASWTLSEVHTDEVTSIICFQFCYIKTTKIGHTLVSHRRMLCCKVTLQLAWNHSIVSKFSWHTSCSVIAYVASPHQKKPIYYKRLSLYFGHTILIAFSLISLSELAMLAETYFTMHLSMMMKTCIYNGQW